MEPKEAKEAEADVIYRTLFWRPLSEVWWSAECSEMKGLTVKGLVGRTTFRLSPPCSHQSHQPLEGEL